MPGSRPLHLLTVVVIGLALFGTSEAWAGDAIAPAQDADPELVSAGARIYADKCVTCHQTGGVGVPGAFPPLAGNDRAADVDYVASVVKDGLDEPVEVLGSIYSAMMEPVDLSADDIAAVAAYVGTLATGASAAPPTTTPTLGPADVDVGGSLFTGAVGFENGGAACSGCHTAGSVGNLGGPGLGPDLTDSISTFGGEAGMTAWLANPASATMTPLFADDPLTDAEIADVVAFLAAAPEQSKPSYFGDALIWAGLAGLLVLLAAMALAGVGNRQTYVEKLRAAENPARARRRDAVGEAREDDDELRGARP